MKKYKKSWLREVLRFQRGSSLRHPKNMLGVAQFHAWESRGESPAHPDPFFEVLCCGKAWWEWTINQIVATYGTPEWCGWAILEEDFRGDVRGLNQIKRRLGRPVKASF